MSILLAVVLFFCGTLFIIKGGDMFVDASGWISDVTGISRAVIGATIVSFATTSPEYFVSTIAILKGYNDLSIGNAVGSLICNLGIGFAALAIFMPGRIGDKLFGVKGGIMIFSTAALWAFCINGVVSVVEAVCLFGIYIVFTYLNVRFSKDGEGGGRRKRTNTADIAKNTAKFIFGAAAIVFGSNLIVDNGQLIAKYMGVSEAIIGLTVVAVGTSLPELVTAITAIIKKEPSLSIGNIIGANTLDATLILATGAFISGGGLAVMPNTIKVDLPFAVLLMLITVIPSAIGKKVYKWQGFTIAAVYCAYLVYLLVFSGI